MSFLRRRVGFFLLLSLGAAAVSLAYAADAVRADTALQLLTLILTSVVIPLLFIFRKETRDALHSHRDQLHVDLAQIRTEIKGNAVAIARLEERDRIAEILDKRLPR